MDGVSLTGLRLAEEATGPGCTGWRRRIVLVCLPVLDGTGGERSEG